MSQPTLHGTRKYYRVKAEEWRRIRNIPTAEQVKYEYSKRFVETCSNKHDNKYIYDLVEYIKNEYAKTSNIKLHRILWTDNIADQLSLVCHFS